MSAIDQTANQMFQSLTGFDEIAVKKEFGADVYTLAAEDRAAFMRALIFVHRRRDGEKAAVAYKSAMDLPQSASTDYFAPEPDADPAGDDEDDGLGEA